MDVLRIVEQGWWGEKPVLHKDLNDTTNFFVTRDTFTFSPPSPRQRTMDSQHRFEGSRVLAESHDNASISWTMLARGSSANTVINNLNAALTHLHTDPRTKNARDRLVEWKPANATYPVYFEVRGPATWRPVYKPVQFDQTNSLEVEVTVPVAPLARGAPMTIYNTTFDSLEWSFDLGAGTITFGSDMVPTTTGEKRMWHSARGYAYEDVQVTCKYTTGATTLTNTRLGVILKRIDSSNFLLVHLQPAALEIYKYDGAVFTQLATTAFTVALSTTYYVRARIEGNVVYAEAFTTTTEPGGMQTPTASVSYTLAGGDATKFGVGKTGDAGLRWVPAETAERLNDFTVMPYTYRNRTSPDLIQVNSGTGSSVIPGDAPALMDLVWWPSGSPFPIFAMASWMENQSTATDYLHGVREAEALASISTWSVTADTTARGDSKLAVTTTSSSGSATGQLTFSPGRWEGDPFIDDVAIEVWARVKLTSTLASPRMAVSIETGIGDPPIYAAEWGSQGKLLKLPSSGTVWRFVRLGTLYVPGRISTARILRFTATWGSGGSGEFGFDYYMVTMANKRVAGPTSKPNNSAYPDFMPSTTERAKRIFYDGTGGISNNANVSVPHMSVGLGGAPITPNPGRLDFAWKFSDLVPDDPTSDATSESEAHAATVHLYVVPRYNLARGS